MAMWLPGPHAASMGEGFRLRHRVLALALGLSVSAERVGLYVTVGGAPLLVALFHHVLHRDRQVTVYRPTKEF